MKPSRPMAAAITISTWVLWTLVGVGLMQSCAIVQAARATDDEGSAYFWLGLLTSHGRLTDAAGKPIESLWQARAVEFNCLGIRWRQMATEGAVLDYWCGTSKRHELLGRPGDIAALSWFLGVPFYLLGLAYLWWYTDPCRCRKPSP